MTDPLLPTPSRVYTDREPLESSLNFEFDRLSTLGYAGPTPATARRVVVIASFFALLYGALTVTGAGMFMWRYWSQFPNTTAGLERFLGAVAARTLDSALVIAQGMVTLVILLTAVGCLCRMNLRRPLVFCCVLNLFLTLAILALHSMATYIDLSKRSISFGPGMTLGSMILSNVIQSLLTLLCPAVVACLLWGRSHDQAFSR